MNFTSALNRWLCVVVFLGLTSGIALAGTVSVTSPINGSKVASPVHVHATYSGTAKYMKVWVDHVSGTSQSKTSTFDTYLTLSAGSHVIVVQAADASTGTVYSSPSISFTVSATNTVTVSPSTATVTEGTTQQFTATDSGGLAVSWSASCGTISSSGMFTAPNATGTCTITASDSTGAKGTATATIAAPSGSPQVTIDSPLNGSTVTSPVHVHATYNGTASYMKLWVDHVDVNQIQQNTSTFDTTISLSAGAHLLEVQAADATTGSVYTTPTNITVTSGTTVTITPSTATVTTGGTQQFTANVPVTWAVAGDGTISSTGLFTAGSTSGSATVTATATDGSGATATASVTVTSTTASGVTITSPAANSTVPSPVHVTATYSGTASYMKLWVDGVANTTQYNPNTFDAMVTLATGKHRLVMQAKDKATGTIYSGIEYITVGTATSTVTVTPSTANVPLNGTLQSDASDSAGLAVTWTASGAGTIDASTGVFTAGGAPGTATVTATASDGAKGTATVTVGTQVTITPSTTNVPISGTQQFSANVSVTWSATGDGSIDNSGLFTAGSTAGTATITGTATDGSKGTATVTVGTQVTITPSTASTQEGGTQQFTANVSVTWSASCGSIDSTGLFTAPNTVGACTITGTAGDGSTGTATDNVFAAPPPGSGNYTTWKNDNLHTGQQRNETLLTPSNVNSTNFGLKFSVSIDGAAYAQPLYVSGLTINGTTHNVVFVATENDSVYAFDADVSGSPLWKKSLLMGGTTVPQANVHSTIYPAVGITGTPVIDPSTNTLYVVAETLEGSTYIHRLHALDLATGNERFGGPVVISGSTFQSKEQLQRPALILANGSVYIGFGSQGDTAPYNGWIFAYSASTLARVGIYNATSAGSAGGIWGAGGGVAADANGNIYTITGNGSYNGTTNLSMSFIKLSPSLTVLDYFTPYDESTLSNSDRDLGSGGVLVVPDQSGAYQHELIGCGKPTPVYVLDADNMGHKGSTSDSQIIQRLPNVVGGTTGTQSADHCFMTPAYWEQNVYFIGNNDVMKAFRLDPSTGLLSTSPTSQSTYSYTFPGAQPVVSSNGSTNGIVWAVDRASSVALHAYDANDLSKELFVSGTIGTGTKWAVPTVINGHVFVGTKYKLYVFGLK